MTSFTVLDCNAQPLELAPICNQRPLGEILVTHTTLSGALHTQLRKFQAQGYFSVFLYPSEILLNTISATNIPWIIKDVQTHKILARSSLEPLLNPLEIPVDSTSIVIRYPWDILALHEYLSSEVISNQILGKLWENVTIAGTLHLGKNSEILPGVMIEGTVFIGENCRIGPNAYIRGATTLGDNVKIGQAVEVKNSIIMQKTAVPHLSYVGDSIIGTGVNIAAGNIISNYRHDGKNHRSEFMGELLDTQRRKFGAIIGDKVHTGINTTIYPGRKIWDGQTTRPGDIIQKDLK